MTMTTIRPAKLTDIESIAHIDIQCFGVTYSMEGWINILEKTGIVNVAVIDDKIVGFVILQDILPETESTEIKNMINNFGEHLQWAEITSIGVLQEYRNKKIGTQLVRSIIDAVQKNYMVCLRVRSSNEQAQKAYMKNNFVFYTKEFNIDGNLFHYNVSILDYYSEPKEDALLMYNLN